MVTLVLPFPGIGRAEWFPLHTLSLYTIHLHFALFHEFLRYGTYLSLYSEIAFWSDQEIQKKVEAPFLCSLPTTKTTVGSIWGKLFMDTWFRQRKALYFSPLFFLILESHLQSEVCKTERESGEEVKIIKQTMWKLFTHLDMCNYLRLIFTRRLKASFFILVKIRTWEWPQPGQPNWTSQWDTGFCTDVMPGIYKENGPWQGWSSKAHEWQRWQDMEVATSGRFPAVSRCVVYHSLYMLFH